MQSLLLLTYTFTSFSHGFHNWFFLLITVCTIQLVQFISISPYLLVVIFLSAVTFLYLHIDSLPPPPRIHVSYYLFLPGKHYMFLLDVNQNKTSAQLSVYTVHLPYLARYFQCYIHCSTVRFRLSVVVQKLFWGSLPQKQW